MAIAPNPLLQYNEFTPQVQGLERQRRMAQMLLQQGMQQPQGQMVSGHYVAPSITQHLANLANVYVSKATEEEADKKQMELAQAYRQAGQQELANFLRAREGTPEQRIAQAGPPTDEMIAKGQFNPEQVIPAVAPLDRLALAMKASQAQYNPMLPMLGAELFKQEFKEPKWERTTITDPRSGNEMVGYVNVNAPNPESTFRTLGMGKPAMSQKDIAELNLAGQKFTYETGQTPNFGGYAISSPQGMRQNPLGQGMENHQGIDVKIPSNVLLSPKNIPELTKDVGGKVLRVVPSEQSGGYGNMVEVQRPDGSIARYAHLNNINVQAGQPVTPDTVYGNPGSTGKSTGVHLHYEVKPAPGTQVAGPAMYVPPGMSPKDVSEAQKQVYVDTEKRRREFAEKAPAALEMMNQTLNNIDAMIGDTKVVNGKIVYGQRKPHAGFESAVGISAAPLSGFIPGTPTTDFKNRLEQVKGQSFLQAFENLKGGGQITEVEGTKATAALNRMNKSQSEVEFIEAAREFEENVRKGMALAKERAGIKQTQSGATPTMRWNPTTQRFE